MIWLRERLLQGGRNQDGFTLIELMVALGMFAVVMISMGVMFTTAFTTASETKRRDTAKNLGQEKLEALRSLPYFIAFGDQVSGTDPDLLDRYFVDLGTSVVTRTVDGVSVQQVYDSAIKGYKTTEAQVSGNPRFSRVITVQFVNVNGVVVNPPSGYTSNATTVDVPLTIARITVKVSWTERGRTLSFEVRTVVRGTRLAPVNLSAKVTALGGTLTSLQFLDGTTNADIIGELGSARSEAVETDLVTSLAEALLAQISERDPTTNSILTGAGGVQQLIYKARGVSDSFTGLGGACPGFAETLSVASDTIPAVADPSVVIASGGQADANACVQFASGHTATPDSRAVSKFNNLLARFGSNASPKDQLVVGSIGVTSTVTGTATSVTAFGEAKLKDIVVWGTHENVVGNFAFATSTAYGGVVKIDEVATQVRVTANAVSGGATARVKWSWKGLKVWNPGTVSPPTSSSYSPASPGGGDCSYDSDVDGNTLPACAAPTFDGISKYGAGLKVDVGPTQRGSTSDGKNATAFQKNVLNIFMRKEGDIPLEPITLGLGNLSAEVSYRSHTH